MVQENDENKGRSDLLLPDRKKQTVESFLKKLETDAGSIKTSVEVLLGIYGDTLDRIHEYDSLIQLFPTCQKHGVGCINHAKWWIKIIRGQTPNVVEMACGEMKPL